MRKIDAAYLAGLIDGEGCIFIAKTKKSILRKGYRFQSGIHVAMTAPSIVKWVHQVTGVGNELSKTANIGLGWFERADGMIQFSARSKGEIDVSAVAKTFNGGGHKNAAGWQLPLNKGREVIDTILGRL